MNSAWVTQGWEWWFLPTASLNNLKINGKQDGIHTNESCLSSRIGLEFWSCPKYWIWKAKAENVNLFPSNESTFQKSNIYKKINIDNNHYILEPIRNY